MKPAFFVGPQPLLTMSPSNMPTGHLQATRFSGRVCPPYVQRPTKEALGSRWMHDDGPTARDLYNPRRRCGRDFCRPRERRHDRPPSNVANSPCRWPTTDLGGWKKSGFGDLNAATVGRVSNSNTRTKTVTLGWPSASRTWRVQTSNRWNKPYPTLRRFRRGGCLRESPWSRRYNSCILQFDRSLGGTPLIDVATFRRATADFDMAIDGFGQTIIAPFAPEQGKRARNDSRPSLAKMQSLSLAGF